MRPLHLASIGLAVCLLASSLAGCDSNADARVALAQLSESCRINSDCGQLLVCVFERCHEQCESSRDCDAGARCVQSPQRRNVCQLPDEQACGLRGDCPGEQVCGIDAECRDACQSDTQCLTEQVCSAGTCADAGEVDAQGLLEASAERPVEQPVPCAFHSDCPFRQVCAAGRCGFECATDAECADDEQCTDRVCEPLPAPESCFRNSDCADDEVCEAGRCRLDLPRTDPECQLDSDCRTSGERCESGECVCECRTAADCGAGQTCDDGCACTGGRVIAGDVRIANERELQLIRDVVEITGRLELRIKGAASYHLPKLRKVADISASGSGGTIWLEGLEEASGLVQCYQDCRLPRLQRAGDVALSSPSFTRIELPALRTVTRSLHVQYSDNLTELSLPELTSAQELSLQVNKNLVELTLPQLREIESLLLRGHDALRTVSLPLASPSRDVEIARSPELESLSLPSLVQSEGTLSLWENGKLRRIDCASLTRINGIVLQRLPLLEGLGLPALERVGGSLSIASTPELRSLALPSLTELGSLTLDDASKLETLDLARLIQADRITLKTLPALPEMNLSSLQAVANEVVIRQTGLTNLTSLLFDAGGSLTSAGPIEITDNPALPICAVVALSTTLSGLGYTKPMTVSGNLQCECSGAACQ